MGTLHCPACGMAELVDEGEGLYCPRCYYKPGPRPRLPEAVRFEIPRRRPAAGRHKAPRKECARRSFMTFERQSHSQAPRNWGTGNNGSLR